MIEHYGGMAPRLIKDRDIRKQPENDAEQQKNRIVDNIQAEWASLEEIAPESFAQEIRQRLERKLSPEQLQILQQKYGTTLPEHAFSRISYTGMESFVVDDPSPSNPYTRESVDNNKRDLRLAKQKNTALDHRKRLATESEKVLAIALNIWFNKVLKAELSAEYDDQLRGIDIVLEKKNADEILLAIDAKTFEPNLSGSQNAHHKIETLQKLYEKNILPEAKYYKTEQGGYGPKMIELVVPVDKKTLFELCALIDPGDEVRMDLLMNHPFRKTFLEIAERELDNFNRNVASKRFTNDVLDEIKISHELLSELQRLPTQNSPFESRTQTLLDIV